MLRLKELRKEAKVTQQFIANILGITRGAYANIENGKREPDFETLFLLANFYNVTTDYILNRTQIKTEKTETTCIFAERLRELREDIGLTSADVAKHINVSLSSYSRYETEEAEPDLETLNKLASMFKVSVDYLLGVNDNLTAPFETKKTSPNSEEALQILATSENLSEESVKYLMDTINLLKIKEMKRRNTEIADEIGV